MFSFSLIFFCKKKIFLCTQIYNNFDLTCILCYTRCDVGDDKYHGNI